MRDLTAGERGFYSRAHAGRRADGLAHAPDPHRAGPGERARAARAGLVSRSYHPIVRLDYLGRLFGCLLVALVVASARWHEPTGAAIWTALALYGLAWPTLAFLVASRSRDSKRVELASVLVDCALIGVWVALASFRPWPTAGFVTGILASAASVGGWRLFAKGVLALAAGAVATGGLATGFRVASDESALTVALSIAGIFLYQLLLATATHRQAQRFVQSRRRVEEQTEQIRRQNAVLDETLQRETATSEALKLMNRSAAHDLDPVLQNIVESAAHLCAADSGIIYRFDGKVLRPVFFHGFNAEFTRAWQSVALTPGRGSGAMRCALERRPIHIPDVLADPEYTNTMARQIGGYRAVLCVPLLRGDSLLGVITMVRVEVRPFAAREIDVLAGFAEQAVIAIDKVDLFRELEGRTSELARANRELSDALRRETATSEALKLMNRSAVDDLEPVLQNIVESAAPLCAADFGIIYRFDGKVLRAAFFHGFTAEFIRARKDVELAPGRGSSATRCAAERRPVHIPDVLADPEYTHTMSQRLAGYRALLSVPLLRGDSLLGVITVARSDPRPFAAREIEVLATFADQAVIAIDKVELFRELEGRTGAVARANSELSDALRRETATSEALKLMNRSAMHDLEPVLQNIVQSAAYLCLADFGVLYRFDGKVLHPAVFHGCSDELTRAWRGAELPPGAVRARRAVRSSGARSTSRTCWPIPRTSTRSRCNSADTGPCCACRCCAARASSASSPWCASRRARSPPGRSMSWRPSPSTR